jgi:hypothetical protein
VPSARCRSISRCSALRASRDASRSGSA